MGISKEPSIIKRLISAAKNGILIIPTSAKSIRKFKLTANGRLEFRALCLETNKVELYTIQSSAVQIEFFEVFDMTITSNYKHAEMKGATESQLHNYFFGDETIATPDEPGAYRSTTV